MNAGAAFAHARGALISSKMVGHTHYTGPVLRVSSRVRALG